MKQVAGLFEEIMVSNIDEGEDTLIVEGTIKGLPFRYEEEDEDGLPILNVFEIGKEYDFDFALYESSDEGDLSSVGDWKKKLNILAHGLQRRDFWYRFESSEFLNNHDDPEKATTVRVDDFVSDYGKTQEEAFESAKSSLQEHYLFHGMPISEFEQFWDSMDVSTTPINTDTRVFPSPEPDFSNLGKIV